MNGFIVVGINSNGDNLYISNTSPILWTSERKECKLFTNFRSAKTDLEDHFIYLSATIVHTDIKNIFIAEYINDIEVGRKRFL